MNPPSAFTAQQVRNTFRSIGYSLNIKRNPLRPEVGNLLVSGNGLNKFMISSATVIPRETYLTHQPMFELADQVRGKFVDEIKIV